MYGICMYIYIYWKKSFSFDLNDGTSTLGNVTLYFILDILVKARKKYRF